jgi:hypothetical protein
MIADCTNKRMRTPWNRHRAVLFQASLPREKVLRGQWRAAAGVGCHLQLDCRKGPTRMGLHGWQNGSHSLTHSDTDRSTGCQQKNREPWIRHALN